LNGRVLGVSGAEYEYEWRPGLKTELVKVTKHGVHEVTGEE